MFITTQVQIVAWSEKGDAVLVETAAGGPEGGGTLEYALFGPKNVVQAKVSNDMSPGDGSTPEHIPAGDCRTAAKALADAVTAAGFVGVEVHPDKCGGDRNSVVMITSSRPLPGAGDGVTVTLFDDYAIVKNAVGHRKIDLEKHTDAQVWRAPNGPLLVISILGDTRYSLDAFVWVGADAAPKLATFPAASATPGL